MAKKFFKINVDNLNAQLRERLQKAEKEDNEVDREFYGAVLWKIEELEKEINTLKQNILTRS